MHIDMIEADYKANTKQTYMNYHTTKLNVQEKTV